MVTEDDDLATITLHFRANAKKPTIISGCTEKRERRFLGLIAPVEVKCPLGLNDWQKSLLGLK